MVSSTSTLGATQVVVPLPGGQRVRVFRSASPGAPLVLIAPALGLRADYYAALCDALARAGMHAAAIDLPGHGESPLRASRRHNWGYLRVLDHLASAREQLRDQLGIERVVWLGHSIGGQVALMDAGREPDAVTAVVLAASGTPYFRNWEGVAAWKVLVGTTFGAAVARMVGHLPGEQLGFAGREASQLIAEWASLSRTGRYACAGIDAEQILARCIVPILSLRFEGDTLAPQRAVEHGLSKVRSKHVDRLTIEPKDQRNIHNRWPRVPEAVVSALTPFVEHFAGLRVASPSHATQR